MTQFMHAGLRRSGGHPRYGHFIGGGAQNPVAGGVQNSPMGAPVNPSVMPPQNQQGGMSSSPLGAAPAGALGVMPGMADGGAIDETSGFGGVANDQTGDAFNTIDQIVQYGRQKHGLTDGWRRSDNVDDGRGEHSGFTALAMKEAAGGDAKNINGSVTATDPMDNSALNPSRMVDAAKAGISSALDTTDGESDSATLAVPGTMAEQAGYNNIQQQYKDGGPVKSVKRYDDGGSVDDDDDDTNDDSTGAIPDDASGGGSDNAPPTQGEPGMASTPNPQKIVSYLTGADAAPPQNVAALERSIDPQGQMDPDTRHAMAIQQAKKQGGDEAAWGVLQHYRQKYDAYRSFAAAALNGVGGKPPDVQAAAQAANQAYTYMPDGTTVQFAPSQNGITATVKRSGQQQPFGSVNLNPQQFNEFVRGKSGQFDNVYENSAAKILQQLQQSQGRPFDQQAQQGGQPQGAPQQQQQPPLQGGPNSQPAPTGGMRRPPPPQASYDFSGTGDDPTGQAEARRQYGYGAPERNSNFDPQIQARAQQMFPNDKQKQVAWQNEQEQQKTENETADTRARRPWAKETADANQAGRLKVAETYSSNKARNTDATNASRERSNAANNQQKYSKEQMDADTKLVTSVQNSTNKVDKDSDMYKAALQAAKRLRANAQQQQSSGNTGGGNTGGGQTRADGARKRPSDPNGPWYKKDPSDNLWHPVQ